MPAITPMGRSYRLTLGLPNKKPAPRAGFSLPVDNPHCCCGIIPSMRLAKAFASGPSASSSR